MYVVKYVGEIVPYVRMTRRGKFADQRAQKYLAWKSAAGFAFKADLGGAEPLGREPLAAGLLVRGAAHTRDLDNILKGVLDAANGVVIADDRWVDRLVAVRIEGESEILFAAGTVNEFDKICQLIFQAAMLDKSEDVV
jgi:hypothetical protein